MGHNTYKFQKLNFQEIPGNRGIHDSGYWKIAGLLFSGELLETLKFNLGTSTKFTLS